jgi:hypothetical protein
MMSRLIGWILAAGAVFVVGLCALGLWLSGGNNNEDPWKPA